MKKRRLSFWEIWNLSFGYLGIQMGFALQNANASRILTVFGADLHNLSWFWIVAPLMGLIVQPIIGHYSDKTWTRFGRRKPYFLVGSLLASLGLILMPQAGAFTALMPALWMGAGFLMIMDASFNIAMEPFRALVADVLPADQRTLGFTVQTSLIGFGAVIGSWLPYILTNWLGVQGDVDPNSVPFNVIFSFIIGAVAIVATVMITILSTKEYSPEEIAFFEEEQRKELGIEQTENSGSLLDIFKDFSAMPKTMRQLGWVQFFTWFALFGMWVYCTPAIATHFYNVPIGLYDELSLADKQRYNQAGDWTGILFGVYNFVSAIVAFTLPYIAFKIGRKTTHALALVIGGLGLISMYFVPNENYLILSMVGIGVAWASILSMPYAILAGSIPAKKMGVYMGIFNFFICMPQIVNSIVGGPIVNYLYDNHAIYALVCSGCFFLIAAFCVRFVQDNDSIPQKN